MNRRAFMKKRMAMPNARVCVFEEDGIQGYGVIRQCQEDYKVGPLFTGSHSIAQALWDCCL